VKASQNLAENKCVEYEGIFHIICMYWIIIFQLQEAYSLEVESKENWNLKQSLNKEQVFSRKIYIKKHRI
jgi:hypothetical protein